MRSEARETPLEASSNPILGSQPESGPRKGWLILGSSSVRGIMVMGLPEPVKRLMASAKKRMETSCGFPMFTGPGRSERSRRMIPSIRGRSNRKST